MRTVRRAYIEANVWELFVATLAIITAIGYFVDPHDAAGVARDHIAFPEVLWNSMYGGGAILVVLGIVWIVEWVELAGLSLFSAAVVIQMIDLVEVSDWRGWVGLVVLGSFALASWTRAWVLVRGATGR